MCVACVYVCVCVCVCGMTVYVCMCCDCEGNMYVVGQKRCDLQMLTSIRWGSSLMPS